MEKGIMPQDIPAVDKSLEDLIQQIKQLTHMSYLDRFSYGYHALSWWKKIGMLLTYIALAAFALTCLLLPPVLLLPLVAVYFLGVFFLSEHDNLRHMSTEKTVDTVRSVLGDAIGSLNVSRDFFKTLTYSTEVFQNSIKSESETLIIENERISEANTDFEDILETFEPLAITVHEVETEVTEKVDGLFSICHNIFDVLEMGKNTLIDDTLPRLNIVIQGLQASNKRFVSMQAGFKETLTEMSGLVSGLSEVASSLESADDEAEVEDALIARAKKVSRESDDLLAMAKRDLGRIPGLNLPSLDFFDKQANAQNIENSFSLPVGF